MLLTPCKKRQIQMANCKKEKRSSGNEREQICGINAGKARAPEVFGAECGTIVSVNKDETGENEKEIHADEANACEVLIPPRAVRKDSDHAHVKQDHVKRGEKAKSGQCVKTGPHSAMNVTSGRVPRS